MGQDELDLVEAVTATPHEFDRIGPSVAAITKAMHKNNGGRV